MKQPLGLSLIWDIPTIIAQYLQDPVGGCEAQKNQNKCWKEVV